LINIIFYGLGVHGFFRMFKKCFFEQHGVIWKICVNNETTSFVVDLAENWIQWNHTNMIDLVIPVQIPDPWFSCRNCNSNKQYGGCVGRKKEGFTCSLCNIVTLYQHCLVYRTKRKHCNQISNWYRESWIYKGILDHCRLIFGILTPHHNIGCL
jgi:hypothetical protein